MVDRLLVDAAVDLAVAVLYAYVGLRLARRPVPEEAAPAQRMFSLWWFALAATGLVAGALSLAAWQGARDPGLFTYLGLLSTATFCLAMLGLVDYLVFLFTGKEPRAALAVLYCGYFALVAWTALTHHAGALDASGWRPVLRTGEPTAFVPLVLGLVLLFLPQVGGALAYLTLYRKVEAAEQRYRIVLVSGSILLWSAGVVVISQPELFPSDALQLAGRAIVLASAVSILAAYQPPGWARKRWEPA
ncbi:MAG: hypothetical protein LC624_03605 [Halobacteriales archaeon]|nr:hypothetical protein [Halobacteriales archaeon]